MAATAKVLKTVVFYGSGKTVVPPWGGEPRIGDRVYKYVVNALKARTDVKHEVTIYDPVEVFAEGGALASSGGQMSAPHFFLKADDVSPALAKMQETIAAADCYVIVTPEYNHTVPPALSSIMGHFGGSNYAYKCSGIVTYSIGPWGGMRCATAAKVMLSELGCSPISKIVGIPTVPEILKPDGTPVDDKSRLMSQLPGMLSDLEWTALAFKAARANGIPK